MPGRSWPRLLREAPSSLSVLIASRRRPDLDLARPMAQGQVAELTTDDLRFSRAETDTLFSETYQQPLEPDVLDQVEQRTEGWAASLQLFRSSIRGTVRPGDPRLHPGHERHAGAHL